MTTSDDLLTDRAHLTAVAYATDAKLATRQSIYRFAQPPDDFISWALSHIEGTGYARVLDAGCGNGVYLRHLANKPDACRRPVGLDLSPGMLEQTRTIVRGSAHVILGDVAALPFAGQSFDLVLAMHMLYHVPDIPTAVRELRRVLRDAGTLLAATNGPGHMQEMAQLFSDAVRALGGTDPERLFRSLERFSLDNGDARLAESFDRVERRDFTVTLRIPEAEAVLGYLETARGHREPALPQGVTWEDVMDRAREIVQERINRHGVFEATSRPGLFICR